MRRMRLLRIVAALVLFAELPVPLYWFVLHRFGHFWRKMPGKAMLRAAAIAWSAGAVFLWAFRAALFGAEPSAWWASLAGLALIVFDVWMLVRVHRELGAALLSGKTEIEGGGVLAETGLYARVRHPRYAAMAGAVAGACLIAGSKPLWWTAAVWLVLAAISIRLEERELRGRFGPAYEEYCRRVPAFLPVSLRRRGAKH